MGKTRNVFKKIRDTKRKFQKFSLQKMCKEGHNKAQNGLDLTEAEDIKKRWQECTEKNIKKLLNVTDNHDGVTNSPRTRYPGM